MARFQQACLCLINPQWNTQPTASVSPHWEETAEALWSSRWRGSWRRRSRGWVEQHEGLVSHQAWPIEWPAHHCFLTSNKCQAACPCFWSIPTCHPYKQLCQPARLLSTNGTGNRFVWWNINIFKKFRCWMWNYIFVIRCDVLRLIWSLWPLKVWEEIIKMLSGFVHYERSSVKV